MLKPEALQAMEQDRKDAVSGLKREEYKRAKDSVDLRVVELQVRTDSRLSGVHRSQLLRRIETAINDVGPEHLRPQAKLPRRSLHAPRRRLRVQSQNWSNLPRQQKGGSICS